MKRLAFLLAPALILAAPRARAADEELGPRAKLEAGYAYRALLGLPASGYTAAFAFGGDIARHAGLYGEASFFQGWTPNGLGVQCIRMGLGIEGIWGRFRLGGGLSAAYVSFSRATMDDSVGEMGLGLHVGATLDLVRFGAGGRALFIAARWDMTTSSFLGPTATLGVRF